MQDVLNAAQLGSVYLLFALGMALAWGGTIGILNFAHGATFMFSAFVAHLVSQAFALPLPLALLISVLTGALISVATQVFAFQPIIHRSRNITTAETRILIGGGIGVASIPLAIAQRMTHSAPFGINTTYQDVVWDLGLFRLSSTSLIVLIAGIGLGLGIIFWLRRSKQGLALRAIGVDSETAAGMGINQFFLSIGTMAVAGGLAGLAGALLTIQLRAIAPPETGDQLIIKAFAIIVLGGGLGR